MHRMSDLETRVAVPVNCGDEIGRDADLRGLTCASRVMMESSVKPYGLVGVLMWSNSKLCGFVSPSLSLTQLQVRSILDLKMLLSSSHRYIFSASARL